jgi:phosphoglucomutase
MWKDEYQLWLDQPNLDVELKAELMGRNESELEDMFYTSLSFGTGGMRGILGAGTNRLNIYTIRKANDGLARYLREVYGDEAKRRGVVIAHDNRRMSKAFALESAKMLGYYGIKSFLFEDLRPTPELSFATRNLNAVSGIVVTASHNPPNYNGYKIYDEFGCQYTPRYADVIVKKVDEVTDLFSINVLSESVLKSRNLLSIIGSEIDDLYLEKVKTVQLHPEIEKPIKIVFTPLHGTSAELGTRLLKECGYDVHPVQEQMVHDPSFSTVKSPNPESPAAFALAIALGKKIGADLLIATDPDADRLGIAIKKQDEYVLLTGNQTGALLINYLLASRKALGTLPKKGIVYNTIVTSDLGAKIARSYGFEVISTLTGFKYIGEQLRMIEGTDKEFLFGYEESYGYVIKDFVRDKDAFQALLLAAEAASYYQVKEQKTLLDKLNDIFEKYGTYQEGLHNIDLFGIEGGKRIARIVEYFRNQPLTELIGQKVVIYEDYLTSVRIEGSQISTLKYDSTNAVKFVLKDGSWFVLRPSGTEPKLKIYIGVQGASVEAARDELDQIGKAILKIVDRII